MPSTTAVVRASATAVLVGVPSASTVASAAGTGMTTSVLGAASGTFAGAVDCSWTIGMLMGVVAVGASGVLIVLVMVMNPEAGVGVEIGVEVGGGGGGGGRGVVVGVDEVVVGGEVGGDSGVGGGCDVGWTGASVMVTTVVIVTLERACSVVAVVGAAEVSSGAAELLLFSPALPRISSAVATSWQPTLTPSTSFMGKAKHRILASGQA